MKALLGILLLLPLTVRAEVFYVDYEGTLTDQVNLNLDELAKYPIGAHLSGRLRVDTLLAGDPVRSTGNEADYGFYFGDPSNPDTHSPDFITGLFPVLPNDADDVATVCKGCRADGVGGMLDRIFLFDSPGKGLSFELDVTKHGLVDNLSLAQSFDLTSQQVRKPGEGLMARFVLGIEESVGYTLSHMSMRPGKCFEHT
jgi:hypothetical protein